MAMLAEPRQRKRYNLVPRGKALYEDEHRFGTKMLEKMGWKKGSGLGANEDGSKDFVRIRYKNDALGLGFEHRDDQWTQHEESFNGLLKTLNNEGNSDDGNDDQEQNGNKSEEEEAPRVGFGFAPTNVSEVNKANAEKLKEKISGISLEERSKQSRARVHYKKFTKGKDLAQYSEKDLANIFGKKAVDEQQQAANDFYQQLNNTLSKKSDETKDSDKEEETIKERYIINTGVSVNDYFKAKMEALKNRTNGVNKQETTEENDTTSNEVQEEKASKKLKKKKKEKKDQVLNEEKLEQVEDTSKEQMIYSELSVNDYFKMKMEALKNKKNDSNPVDTLDETNKAEALVQDEGVSKKKKKKKKSKDEDNVEDIEQMDQDNVNQEVALETSKKEKKSKKRKAEESEQTSNEEEIKPKKKKDKTKMEIQEETIQQTEQAQNSHETAQQNKQDSKTEQQITEIDLTEEEPRKKKKKKSKSKEPTEVIEIIESDQESAKEKKKNKKKMKKEQNAINTAEKENNLTNTSQTVHPSDEKNPNKPKKSKRKEVSATAKNVFKSDVNIQLLDLEELKKKYQSFNIYPISSFCAEKFRNINLNNFTGSTLPQIEGYSLGPELQLDVKLNTNDEERITNLWNCVLNKYMQLEKPKKTYIGYIRDVIKARKAKKKPPKFYVKTWKRKNAFQAI